MPTDVTRRYSNLKQLNAGLWWPVSMAATSPRTRARCCWDRWIAASVWSVGSACFTDRRDPRYVEHRIETLVGQRIFGLVLGYEDLNDHDELRKDPTFGVLAGKLHPVLRSDCEALAGKSTLNRLEHTPRRHAAKYHKIDCDGARVDALLVELFLEAHGRAPREIVLDSTTPTSRCTAARKAASFMAIMMSTATCRSTCSAAGTCCWPGSGARTSPAAMTR